MKLVTQSHPAPRSQLQAVLLLDRGIILSSGTSLGALETDLRLHLSSAASKQGEPWASSIPSLSPKGLVCKVG